DRTPARRLNQRHNPKPCLRSVKFTVPPVVIMGIYLWLAKKQGAFDAL
ncbi:hypothetical protein GOZ85_25110, partial [Agrobacterium vitis]|nr:hypothetical protein [Agrobacterium vitis]